MKIRSKAMVGAAVAAMLVVGGAVPSMAVPQAPRQPLSLDMIANDPALWGVTMSRDGKHVAGLAGIPGQNPVIRIWKVDDLSAPPVQIGSRTMRFTGVSFVKNDRLMIFANQPVSAGINSNWFTKLAFVDVDGTDMQEIRTNFSNFTFLDSLPNDPDHVIVQATQIERVGAAGGDETSSGEVSVFRFNIRNLTSERLIRIGDNYETYAVRGGGITSSQGITDAQGNLRVRQTSDTRNDQTFLYYEFRNDAGQWVRLPAMSYNIRDRFTIVPTMMSADGKRLLVRTNKFDNFQTIRWYDIATDTFSDPIFQHTEFDASSVSFWTPATSEDDDPPEGEITGFCFSGPAPECTYTDPLRSRIMALLEAQFPGRQITIGPRQEGKVVLVQTQGPDSPPEFYILKNERQLVKLGGNFAGPTPAFGQSEWVYFPARDGMQIPAIVTYPPGYDKERDGRIPLVVMPHGGPWARDVMDWDGSNWRQMFATRGFAVMEPQYRGSNGLGMALWKAGDQEWGSKMQDDKDDGARWLVAQGVADPDRMMMYGYSYGGFAAASAATRSSDASAGLWQCAISGAPAIDLGRIATDWGDSRIQRRLQGWTVAGRDPFKDLDKVRIPWLVFHGDFDRQADTVHSRTTAARMRQVNPSATFRYVEIPRMAHQFVQMTPDHRRWFTGLIFDWMDKNCGNISTTFTADDPEFARQAARTR